jgi:apolipoprotein N-acyltransferase
MHLTATNSGVTAAIDRDGAVLLRLPQFVEGRLVAAVQGYAGATPYVRFGDWPAILFAALVLVIATMLGRRRK